MFYVEYQMDISYINLQSLLQLTGDNYVRYYYWADMQSVRVREEVA